MQPGHYQFFLIPKKIPYSNQATQKILVKFSYSKKFWNCKFQTQKILRSSPSLEMASTPWGGNPTLHHARSWCFLLNFTRFKPHIRLTLRTCSHSVSSPWWPQELKCYFQLLLARLGCLATLISIDESLLSLSWIGSHTRTIISSSQWLTTGNRKQEMVLLQLHTIVFLFSFIRPLTVIRFRSPC